MGKLKPCPFCGEQPTAEIVRSALIPDVLYRIRCDTCHFTFERQGLETEVRRPALEAWNRRTPTEDDR